MKIYSHAIDGAPEVKRPFIAFSQRHKDYGIYTRQDKEEILAQHWGNEKDHMSFDGEFYADYSHHWIYQIVFDKYIYLDDLDLK